MQVRGTLVLHLEVLLRGLSLDEQERVEGPQQHEEKRNDREHYDGDDEERKEPFGVDRMAWVTHAYEL